eukprot:g33672.t1
MFERVAFILALAWGAREPEDASMMQMQKKPQAKKLHFLSMGRSGSCFWGDLFGNKGHRPYIFEPFNGNGWGLWSEPWLADQLISVISPSLLPNPFDVLHVLYYFLIPHKFHVDLAPDEEEQAVRRLVCLYQCKGCEGQVSQKFKERVDRMCSGQPDRSIIKTVALFNASTLLRIPLDDLKEQKFVLMLRDPRSMKAAVLSTRVNRAEDSPWCRHFFKLVGYPFSAEIPKVPENSTWQERKEALPYDTLRDPAHVPMTAEERQILQDLGGNGKERSTHVGMALSEDGRFCVANYFPAGNVMGHFKENVLPRGSPYVKESVDQCCGGAGGARSSENQWGEPEAVTGKAWDSGMRALLEGCPFPFKDSWAQLCSIFDAHNIFRKEHGVCALQWSDECYKAAKAQANACQARRLISVMQARHLRALKAI